MIRRITRRRVPRWGAMNPTRSPEQWITAFEARWATYERQLREMLDAQFRDILDQINTQVQGVGEDLVAATSIKPTHPMHFVSGSAAISSIDPPNAQVGLEDDYVTERLVSSFSGPIVLIPTVGSSWTLTTGGNIALAATSVDARALVVYYARENWYPSYV